MEYQKAEEKNKPDGMKIIVVSVQDDNEVYDSSTVKVWK